MWIGEYDCRLAAGYRMWPPKTPDGNTNISTGSRTSTCPGADTMEQVPVQRHSFKLRLELRLTLLQQAAVQRVARALRDHPSMSELAIGDQNDHGMSVFAISAQLRQTVSRSYRYPTRASMPGIDRKVR